MDDRGASTGHSTESPTKSSAQPSILHQEIITTTQYISWMSLPTMSTLADKQDADRVENEPLKKPAKLFAHPMRPSDETHPEAVSGTVLFTQADNNFPLLPPVMPREHPTPHRGFMITSLVLSGITGVLALGSISIAAVTLSRCSNHQSTEEGESLGVVLALLCHSFVMAESCLCFIATLTCFALLLRKPHRVLTREPNNGSFICLCVSIFLLFLFSIYSIIFQALSRDFFNHSLVPPTGVCAVHCARAIGLVSFFAVLVANSKVLPHDPCM